MPNDIALINELLSHQPSPLRRTSLLEALGQTHDELPQSLYLAWLLGPRGPLTNDWLLRRLLKLVAPTMPWPGEPLSVLPEVSEESERPDIVAKWDHFKLLVEYKVNSPEGDHQIERYLETFRINSSSNGLIVYLTPTGRWPGSAQHADERVRPLTFRKVVDCIDEALTAGDETSERGRALVGEYRDCLNRILCRSIDMGKPVISESTKLLSKHHKHFDRLSEAAHQEGAEFIQHMLTEAERRLRPIVGEEMMRTEWAAWGVFLFRKSNWVTEDLEYGFAYSAEGKLGTKRIDKHDHAVSVKLQPIEHGKPLPTQEVVAEALRKAIASDIPSGADDGHNKWHAFFRAVPFEANTDWDKWAESVISDLCFFAKKLTPHLDRFAARASK